MLYCLSVRFFWPNRLTTLPKYSSWARLSFTFKAHWIIGHTYGQDQGFTAEGTGYLIILPFGVIDVNIVFGKNLNPSPLPHVEIGLSEDPLKAPMICARGKLLA